MRKRTQNDWLDWNITSSEHGYADKLYELGFCMLVFYHKAIGEIGLSTKYDGG